MPDVLLDVSRLVLGDGELPSVGRPDLSIDDRVLLRMVEGDKFVIQFQLRVGERDRPGGGLLCRLKAPLKVGEQGSQPRRIGPAIEAADAGIDWMDRPP